MEVVEKSADRLVLKESRGWFPPLFGLLFIAIGVVVFFLLAQSRTIACTRLEPQLAQCEITNSVFGISVNTRLVNDFQFAYVAESIGDEGDSTYQVILAGRDEQIPLTTYFSSGFSDKQEVADQLNRFNRVDAPEFVSVEDRPGIFNYLFGLIFVGLGGLVLVVSWQREIYTLDRTANVLIYTRRGVFGQKDRSFDLDRIADIYLQGDDGRQRIVLVLSSSEDVPLTITYSSGQESKGQLVKEMKAFLA